MVRVTAAVVAHRGANVFGDGVEVADEVLDRFAFEVGFAFERLVQIGDVSLVMFVVMDLHRLCIDVRLQGVVRVG